jgi:16S rRNA G1207 methylase RsmC
MKHERWHKKDVSLTWNANTSNFAVAQELFSSHDVDAGSKVLLKSLDIQTFPARGRVIDFGCGYGVLGLALRDALPGWTVDLIDRDALAVAFSRWNARRLGFDDDSVRAVIGLGVDSSADAGADLIVWNVPGKAGETVLRELTGDVTGALAQGGLVALVVVNPLADVIRDSILADDAMEVTRDDGHADHTVIHARRNAPAQQPGDPFDRGVFDRQVSEFGVDDYECDIMPVVGLPEYDSYAYATQVTFDALRAVDGPIASVLMMRPGQGHIPVVVGHQLNPLRLTLVDRDQLALRASSRALVDAGIRVPRIETVATPDLIEVPHEDRFSLIVLMLEDQVRNDIHIARIEDLATLVAPGGSVLVGGTSSVVSRFLSFAAKARGWKVRDRLKRSGASAARLERIA